MLIRTTLILAMVLAVGCESDDVPRPSRPQGASLPANLLLSSAPANPRPVKDLHANSRDGDTVTVRGVVGGRSEPIAQNRAMLTLLDPSISTCNKLQGDSCPTPWDACCEPADVLAANTATVQVVDAQGAVIKTGLENVGGIKPLKEMVVTGKLRLSPDGKSVAVDATGLYVVP